MWCNVSSCTHQVIRGHVTRPKSLPRNGEIFLLNQSKILFFSKKRNVVVVHNIRKWRASFFSYNISDFAVPWLHAWNRISLSDRQEKGHCQRNPPATAPHPHPSFGGEVKFPTEDMENDDEYVHVHKSLVWCKIVFLIKERKKENCFFFLKKSRCILLIT